MDAEQVIEIKEDDILDNMEYILENSNIFQVNSNIESLKCYIFYYDAKKMLNFKKYELQINDNKLTKKELLALVLKHNKVQHKSFDLTGIYKYELDLEDKQIKDFCKNASADQYKFVTQYSNIQDIEFHPGIQIFNDNNGLLLFFSNKTQKSSKSEQAKEIMNNQKNKTQKKVKFLFDKNNNADDDTTLAKNKTMKQDKSE